MVSAMRDYRVALTDLADRYAAARGVSRATVAKRARNDGKFFDRLARGGSISVDVYCDLVEWFDREWPHGLAWPRGVARPSSQPRTAAG